MAAALVAGPFGAPTAQAKAKAHILLAMARQRAGLLEQAADSARTAADLTAEDADIEINVKARHALIAALADCGMLDEAWNESAILANIVSDEVDEQLAGKAYWVIGNVAFLCNNVEEGLRYHELAAATFSPARNLDVWAKFNKASAAMRLAADVADADTLRCIERAELATDVIGGSPNDYHLLKLNRAHWTFLAGDAPTAIGLLEELCRLERRTFPAKDRGGLPATGQGIRSDWERRGGKGRPVARRRAIRNCGRPAARGPGPGVPRKRALSTAGGAFRCLRDTPSGTCPPGARTDGHSGIMSSGRA